MYILNVFFCLNHQPNILVQVMYDLARLEKKSNHMVEGLCLLNYLLTNTPSNFHAKLLSLQLCHRLGLAWGAHKMYELLDIKHIQLDSCGFLHCAQLCSSGMPSIAKSLFDQTLNFFVSDYQNSVEFLKSSYSVGSFSKLQEFMDFRDRLANSIHYNLISVEALILEISCFSGR
jgi:N-terminal acetyltransferase B complex non-catalytic subunit